MKNYVLEIVLGGCGCCDPLCEAAALAMSATATGSMVTFGDPRSPEWDTKTEIVRAFLPHMMPPPPEVVADVEARTRAYAERVKALVRASWENLAPLMEGGIVPPVGMIASEEGVIEIYVSEVPDVLEFN